MSSAKTYLVVGANKGLGLAIVQALVSRASDALVVATARDVAGAGELQALKKEHQGRLEVVAMDVADETSVQAAAVKVAEVSFIKAHGLDMLVHNAGVNPGTLDTALEMKIADLDANLKVNLYGAIHTIRAFLPLVRKGAAKRIVVVSSGVASNAWKFNLLKPGDLAAYAVSKAAINHYVLRLALALQAEDAAFNVTLYSPGIVDTAQNRVDGFPYPKMSSAEAASLWYERFVIEGPRETGSFISHEGEVIPW